MPSANRYSLRRSIIRGVAIFLSVIFLLLAYTCCIGFPGPVRAWVQSRAESVGLYLELGSMKLGWGNRLVLREVKIFEMGAIGPAMVEAHEVNVGFDIVGLHRGEDVLQDVIVRNGRLRKNATIRALFSGFESRSKSDIRMDVMIRLQNCDLYGLDLTLLTCPLVIDEDGVSVEGIKGVMGTGKGSGPFEGRVVSSTKSGTCHGNFTTRFDPRELLAFLRIVDIVGLDELIESCVYRAEPCQLEAAFMQTPGPDRRLIVNGHFRGSDFRYQGADVATAETPVVVERARDNRSVTLTDLRISRPEGKIRLKLAIDLITDMLRFEGSSTADPRAVAMMIHRRGPSYLQPFNTGGPVEFTARGTVCYTNELDTDVVADVNAQGLGYSHYVTDACSFRLKRLGFRTEVSDFRAKVYGGKVSGSGSVYPDVLSTNLLYRMEGVAEDIDFKRLLAAWNSELGDQADLTGKLQGDLELSGDVRDGTEDLVKGRGTFKIREGRIFQLPLFGALSSMLVKIVPGLEYTLRQTDADVSFKITDGKAHTDELVIAGALLGVKADGDYYLGSQRVEFDAELRFLKAKTFVAKIARIITFPISELFKVRLKGTVADPVWESVNL